jgi:hypothetical protein
MLLVLCDPADKPALWAGQQLRKRGVMPVEFVSPAELLSARRLEYRAENGKPVYAVAELGHGRKIDTRQLRGTINRANRIEYPQIRLAAVQDRNYVQAEMDAPVFNPANPSGWCGASLHPFAWALHAQTAGLATLAYRCGYSGLERPPQSNQPMSVHLVFGDRTFPDLPLQTKRAAIALATRVGIPLMGITLEWSPEGKATFIEATPMPNLRLGGDAFINALIIALAPTPYSSTSALVSA